MKCPKDGFGIVIGTLNYISIIYGDKKRIFEIRRLLQEILIV